jgi:hypothetical protein
MVLSSTSSADAERWDGGCIGSDIVCVSCELIMGL